MQATVSGPATSTSAQIQAPAPSTSISTRVEPSAEDATAYFYLCLADTVQLALQRYPHDTGRIQRAAELVRQGHVRLIPDEKLAEVKSSTGRFSYLVSGQCQCKDFQRAPGGKCKHRYGVSLLRRTLKMLAKMAVYTHHVA